MKSSASSNYKSSNSTIAASVLPAYGPTGNRQRCLPAFLEFFAGSGLVAEAFKGIFAPAWANDICPKKSAVYIANHGADRFHLKSINDVSGLELPRAALAWASFPCQDLSLAGNAAGIYASRSGLVWQWLRVIDEMPETGRPRVLVAENVAGLVSADAGKHYRVLHNALVERGYSAGAMLIDASLWVPQSRPRIFVVAVRDDLPIPDRLTAPGATWLHPDAVERAAQGLENWIYWSVDRPTARKRGLSDIIEWTAPYAESETDKRNVGLIAARHAKLLNAYPISKTVALPGYKRTRNGRQVLELRFDDVAGCLRTPEGGSSRQVVVIRRNGEIHSRLLTVREAARLMGAPAKYKIPGTYNDGYKAMGDAVAVPVARWLAKKLLLPLVLADD